MLDTLCRREAGEQVDNTIIFAVGLGLEVHVEMRLLLIVARLEGILRHTIGDDCLGDHDGRSVEESKRRRLELAGTTGNMNRRTEERRSIYLCLLPNVVQQLAYRYSVVALLKPAQSSKWLPIFKSIPHIGGET